MLKNLIKYDLKRAYKTLIIFYFLAFIFSCLGRIFSSIENSILFGIVGNICSGFSFGMVIGSLIYTVLCSWERFIKNIYKDEAYLTHTLPIDKKTIYASKILSSIICSFTTIILIVLCISICFYSKENIEILKKMLELAASTYNTTIIKIIMALSVIAFLEIVFILLIGYDGIILGHQSNKNKIAKSIIYSFLLYTGTQTISLILIIILGLFNSNIMNIINTTNMVDLSIIKFLFALEIGTYLIYNIVFYILGDRLFKKGVNID